MLRLTRLPTAALGDDAGCQPLAGVSRLPKPSLAVAVMVGGTGGRGGLLGNPWPEPPHEQTALDRQISATDQQIDQEVYALYGLTPEGIALVEASA